MDGLLNALRDDFARITGKPFTHFFCPILCVDEPSELCRGHIVPAAVPRSSRKTVIQRADIDSFYGSIVEADIATWARFKGMRVEKLLAHPHARRRIRPQLLCDGKPVPFRIANGHLPQHQTPLRLTLDNGEILDLVIDAEPVAVEANIEGNWELVANASFVTPAIASMLKAAHLSMFSLLGYRYVFSAGGQDLAQILREFYLRNRGLRGRERNEAAEKYFAQYEGMLYPLHNAALDLRGTAEDGKVLSLVGSSGKSFAAGVLVRTAEDLHVVFILGSASNSAISAYFDLLREPPESCAIQIPTYSAEQKAWQIPKGQLLRIPFRHAFPTSNPGEGS